MKRALKIILTLLIVILVLGGGFILTLQIFEYRPADSTNLTIEHVPVGSNTTYVPTGTTLKILTFNTGYASLSQTEDFVMDGGVKGRMDSQDLVETNIAGIADILESEAADFYLLQEVDTDSHRSYGTNQYEYYQTSLSTTSVLAFNYRCIFVPFPLSFSQMMGKVNSGIATYTDYTTVSATREQLPGSFSWPLRLANLKRALLITKYPIDGSDKELVMINVHMSAYDDGSMRAEETEALQSYMQTEIDAGNYVIVGGDFNQTFPDAVDITTGSNDTVTYDYVYPLKDPTFWQAPPLSEDWFVANGFQFGVDITTPTCRLLNHPYDTVNLDNNQYYVIDGFIVSSNITISSVETLDKEFLYSDHNPVVIELVLN
ncbi:MAG: endonuclease [Bacilli bacterium]|nr:endonuclease [Bacilli bacterium]MBN2877745.1 endonuclease [Bacilli bacterium]